MIFGFTGTQEGMTRAQKTSVRRILHEAAPGDFHHGDCIGADVEAARMAHPEYVTYAHVPENESKRAFHASDVIYPGKPYMERNQDIVDVAEALIATPSTTVEKLRSGTWATVRRARARRIPIYLVMPSGNVVMERDETRLVTKL